MQTPFEFMIGLTYTRRGRRGRRKDGFMSFISGMSVASIALGVAALIIVLSVMNGFQKEVRDRMLSVIPHVEIRASKGALTDVEGVEKVLQAQSDVVAVAPFVEGQGLFSSGAVVRGAVVKGIDPAKEPGVSELAQSVSGAELSDLKPKAFQVILGRRQSGAACARREHDAGGTDSPHEAAHGRGLLFERALRIRFDLCLGQY